MLNLLYPLGIQHKRTAGLKHLAYQIYFQFKNQVLATVEEFLMIRGVGHKIALLTLQYAFNLIEVSLFTSLKYFVLLLTQVFSGHSSWYSCSKLGEISGYDRLFQCKKTEYVCHLLERKSQKITGNNWIQLLVVFLRSLPTTLFQSQWDWWNGCIETFFQKGLSTLSWGDN